MQPIMRSHANWLNRFIRAVSPAHGLEPHPIEVSHGKFGLGPKYTAVLHHPAGWDVSEALSGVGEAAEVEGEAIKHHPEGRWITLHPGLHHDEEAESARLFVHPAGQGYMRVAGGGGGRWNGVLVSGVLDHDSYRKLASTRVQQSRVARRVAKAEEEMRAGRLKRGANRGAGGEEIEHAEHPLEMSDQQQADYAEMLHYSARAQHGKDTGEPDVRALGRLNPHGWMEALAKNGGDTALASEEMHTKLDKHQKTALHRVMHAHPDSSKAAWLTEFLGKTREPSVVYVKDEDARQHLLSRLRKDGHSVAASFPESEDAALNAFHPEAGRPTAQILLTDKPLEDKVRQHHAVYYDMQPKQKPDGAKAHLSRHILLYPSEVKA